MVDRAKAAREINELQDAVADKHRGRIERAILDAMLTVARDLPTRQRPDPPLDHFTRIETALKEMHRDTVRRAAALLVGNIKSGFEWLETKAAEDEFYERLYEEYTRRYGGASIASVTTTTRQQIAKLIESGLKQGLSVDEIAENIEKAAPVISDVRSRIISRTETHSAAMFASTESARRSSTPLNKEWVSVEDGRVRDFGEGDGVVDDYSHRAMNEVTVPLDDPFEVPMRNGLTEKLMFPGDPNGSAGNIINCRCAQVYVPSDEPVDPEDEPRQAIQRDPGGPEFRYLTIDPPKTTTAAMNAFMLDNEIADVAELKGISGKTIAKHLPRFLEIKERFDLDPMIAVGPASRFLPRGRGRISAVAAIYPVTNMVTGRKAIWHIPTTFGQRTKWERMIVNEQLSFESGRYTSIRDKVFQGPKPSDEVRQRAARMDASGKRFAFGVEHDEPGGDADSAIRAVIDHEFGHVLHLSNTKHPEMGDDINTFLRDTKPLADGWQYLVSRYSGTNPEEYVAETFSLYMRGDEDQFYRIHPELLAIYQKYDRASGAKSVRLLLPGVGRMDRLEDKADAATNDGMILIQTVLAAAPEDRGKLRKRLLDEYTGEDKETVTIWLDEALALEVVDTI